MGSASGARAISKPLIVKSTWPSKFTMMYIVGFERPQGAHNTLLDLCIHIRGVAAVPAMECIDLDGEEDTIEVELFHVHVDEHGKTALNSTGSIPTHVGCVINGNKWGFKASPNVEYVKGQIILDTIYASGQFSRVNPIYNEAAPRMFDFNAKLASSLGSMTDDEFYEAIPSAYCYQRHFKDYLKVVHEIDDDKDSKAYLTHLKVPKGTPDVFGHGYVIHHGILDSITQDKKLVGGNIRSNHGTILQDALSVAEME